jgi:uncharacterized coiled-coil protein SlyX
MRSIAYVVALLSLIYAVNVSATSNTQDEIALLKAQLKLLQQKIEALEKAQANHSAAKKSAPNPGMDKPGKAKPDKDLKFYATIRPTYGYIDNAGESTLDVRDALSHMGVKSTHQFSNDFKATLHGEWGIDLSNNGDFGKARQVYVALDTPLGEVGIGKQRPAQYLYIAEYIDIFNHASSPFAYDPESIFFVNNFLTYSKQFGDFTFKAGAQYDGENGDNYSDLFNAGLSYDVDNLHLAMTYQNNQVYDAETHLGENSILAFSGAYTFPSDLYLAVGYQDKQYDRIISNDRDGSTFDISLGYPITKHYKLKLGYFDFDDGQDNSGDGFDGYNVTLEWLPADKLRFHLEYLTKDFANNSGFDSISVGFRYDYIKFLDE